jgi:hypothetical protein
MYFYVCWTPNNHIELLCTIRLIIMPGHIKIHNNKFIIQHKHTLKIFPLHRPTQKIIFSIFRSFSSLNFLFVPCSSSHRRLSVACYTPSSHNSQCLIFISRESEKKNFSPRSPKTCVISVHIQSVSVAQTLVRQQE